MNIMAGGITVTPEQLTDISNQLSRGASDIETTLGTLASAVSPLHTDWVGAAQAKFEALWEEWQKSATSLHEALSGVAKLTADAASSYSSTEESIASSFNQS
jgi:WXG100 family type VII secretion target